VPLWRRSRFPHGRMPSVKSSDQRTFERENGRGRFLSLHSSERKAENIRELDAPLRKRFSRQSCWPKRYATTRGKGMIRVIPHLSL